MICVAHLISSLSTGGAEGALYSLLRNLDRAAFESRVVSLTRGGALAESIRGLGVPVESLNMAPGWPDPRGLLRLRRLLRVYRPAVLQTWLYHADLLGLGAARLAGVPAVAWNVRCSTTDARYQRGLTGLTVRLLARLSAAPAAVVINSQAGISVHEGIGYRPRRWEMIPNGFDLDRFRPDADARASVRRELGVDADAVLVGLIARYDPLKDHATFFEAAARLAGTGSEAHFVLAGSGVDAHNPALSHLAGGAGLVGRVHLLGPRPDVPRLTAALDVATCSSKGEGFPNIVGEAMACGVPVATTYVGDVRAIVGETGMVVPPEDPAALAAAWRSLLDLTPEERRGRGARARERIAERYNLGTVTERYAALYRELASA